MAVQNLSSHQGPSICRVKNNLQYPILKLLPKTAQNYIMDHLTQQSINGRSSVCVSHTGTYTKLLYTNKGPSRPSLLESSFWFDTIFLGVRLKFFKCIFVRLSFYLNSEDPDEMSQCAAFHPGLHCLLKYPFRGFLYTKGLQSTGMPTIFGPDLDPN